MKQFRRWGNGRGTLRSGGASSVAMLCSRDSSVDGIFGLRAMKGGSERLLASIVYGFREVFRLED